MKAPAKPVTARAKTTTGLSDLRPRAEDVTRRIKASVERLLWGRAAGRCEFSGCNAPLWKSPVTQEPVNLAQMAHIYAFSTSGPRGNKGIAKTRLNQVENLILVCHGCHQKIDKEKDGGRYTVDLLRQWKADHERRIEIVTGIDPRKKSHVVLYGANVGDHSPQLNFSDAAAALFPTLHPADDKAIMLGMINSATADGNPTYWQSEADNLSSHFDAQIRSQLKLGTIGHVSVFALAPQPLLILLGTLLSDITSTEVFQRHREPQTWHWPASAPPLEFQVQAPASFEGTPALVVALSAPITDDRITAVLGPDVAIWRVTVPAPNNDLIKSRAQLSAFRTLMRPLLDHIKDHHGQTTTLHVFPVTGVSAAIELGRVRMPKAHMPWQTYDQVNDRGGFIPALLLPSGD